MVSAALDCGALSSPGPYSLTCLTSFWLEVGCTNSGTAAPVNVDDVSWWNARTVQAVKEDMHSYYLFAIAGDTAYIRYCFG